MIAHTFRWKPQCFGIALFGLALAAGTVPTGTAHAGLASGEEAGEGPGGVRMFEVAPSVDELRDLLVPESKPRRRTRSIEIVAHAPAQAFAAAPVTPPTPAAYAAPAPLPATAPAPAAAPVAAVRAETVPERTAAPKEIGFRINFGFDSATVLPDSQPFLDQVAELMRQEPRVALVIEGHTDAVGSDGYNLDLSKRRANAVKAYLTQEHDIDPSRLAARGKGESEPLADDPFDGSNRRVQFARKS